ncbi:hypothetical protein KIPB_005854 [Kipferlia bialata]|uniref:Uncharacterized protein n=1 Tax=Kipferlia bialata TaxID=797122 RepID=A0A9K3CWB8_9EUKA|nr:hypothetical protein KIPB_005854 [Kipferlia bialata]|eukprot:g5854.t1
MVCLVCSYIGVSCAGFAYTQLSFKKGPLSDMQNTLISRTLIGIIVASSVPTLLGPLSSFVTWLPLQRLMPICSLLTGILYALFGLAVFTGLFFAEPVFPFLAGLLFTGISHSGARCQDVLAVSNLMGALCLSSSVAAVRILMTTFRTREHRVESTPASPVSAWAMSPEESALEEVSPMPVTRDCMAISDTPLETDKEPEDM